MQKTAILGAGMMGIAIGAAHVRCGLPVLLYDSAETALTTASARMGEELRMAGNAGLTPAALNDSLTKLLTCTGNLDDVRKCRYVIETIPEKIKAKQKLYKKLTADVPPEFFLFTNTSTLSISQLAENLSPEWQRQFCGFHFFHPVRQRSLLEIIASQQTAPATVEAAVQHAQRIEKRPITVGDAPGFLVNRILNPFLSSALSLLEEGIDLRDIESAATEFGMKMGPFRMMDEIGLDVVMHAGWVLFKAYPDRAAQHPILVRLVERGELGRKTGIGFMTYPNSVSWDGSGEPRPLFLTEQRPLSVTEMIRRLFVPMYEEAVRCYEDGVIADPRLADTASVEALGFPAEKGGIVTWGKTCH